MPANRNTDQTKEVARQQLALAVETLSNIHYLIEQSRDDPDSVKQYLEIVKPAMEALRDVARGGGVRAPFLMENSSRPSAKSEDAQVDPLPLATAGNDADPETRVDRLEAD